MRMMNNYSGPQTLLSEEDATTLEHPADQKAESKQSTRDSLIRRGKKVFAAEAEAVAALSENLDDGFAEACELLLNCEGRVVVCGVGKSGHIANKIAATLASTGTPAFFVHPGEASHGDLGMILPEDVVIAISYGGESSEIKTILPVLKQLGARLIAITGKPDSSLANASSCVLNVSVKTEACPLGLAPTSSTTATLAMGDALAVAVLESRGFKASDFAVTHPGGKLGRKLVLTVADVMVDGNTAPLVTSGALLKDALYNMSAGQLGFLAVVSSDGKLEGVFSDGDLRRALDRNVDINMTTIDQVMTRGGHTVGADKLAVDALDIMQKHKIYALPVLDNTNRVCGALNMHTLLQAGVV